MTTECLVHEVEPKVESPDYYGELEGLISEFRRAEKDARAKAKRIECTANKLAKRMLLSGQIWRLPNCLTCYIDDFELSGLEWFLDIIKTDKIIVEQEWAKFGQPIYGGYGHCGYFIENYEVAWYLGGVEKAIEVEVPFALRKRKPKLHKGGYCLYTPYPEDSRLLLSRLKTPLPPIVKTQYEYAKSTKIFSNFLVASPDPDIFRASRLKRKKIDPILVGEKSKRYDRDRDEEYAHEWLVIAVWNIAAEIELA